ncbi:hypothetical protein BH09ACT4_BH09ACT4_05090 [soil metagenome]
MRSRPASALALAGALLLGGLALTGCGTPASPSAGGSGGSGGATSAPPAPGDGGSLGGELAIPDTFPTSEVPLIEGDVAYAQDLGTGWVVYIHRDDFLAGYEEAKGLLTGAGFAGDTVNQTDAGAVGQFTTDTYTVNLSAGDGTDLGVGPSVGYTVVKN